MKKNILTLYLIMLAVININAIDLAINLLDARTRNDTLFVKYRVRNLTPKKLVVYNIQYCDYSFSKKRKSSDSLPSVKVLILKNGKMPLKLNGYHRFRCIFPIFDSNKILRDMIFSHEAEYEILEPNQGKEYSIRLDLYYSGLYSGKYKMQLIFYSSDYYRNDFEKIKLKNDSLKQYQYFLGTPVYSNILTFKHYTYK
jgi:hypothetical protein